MRRWIRPFILAASVLAVLVACTSAPADSEVPTGAARDPLRVVTSFTILEDMVRAIGGDFVTVHNLVPTGTDPHEYEPLPDDIRAAVDADLLVSNGLNLEGGEEGWFARLVTAAGQSPEHVVEVSRDIPPMYLGKGGDEQINPHAFIDPGAGLIMAETIRDALMRADPDRASIYSDRGAAYIAEIDAIRMDYEEQLAQIPEERRILVTSERAFQYVAEAYGLTERFIWEIDTDEKGSVGQIIDLVEALRDEPVRYLVMESNKDRRPMEMVSEELDLPIYPEPIYSDEIGGSASSVASTYLTYLEHNLGVLVGALGSPE